MGLNDFATTHPELVDELVIKTLASMVKAGSNQKTWWRCKKDARHEWETTFEKRTREEDPTGCPFCTPPVSQVLPGVTDLATTHPDIAEQLVISRLGSELLSSSNKKCWWRCDENPQHVWEATVANRTREDEPSGCPFCSPTGPAFTGETDIATTHPDLVREFVIPELATVLKNRSAVKVWWRCLKDPLHEWEASPAHRKGCPVCSNKKVVPGVNDLATTHPDLVNELVIPSLARELTVSAGKSVWWHCSECTHHWQATVDARTGGTGCPNCNHGGISLSDPAYFYVVHSDEILKCGISNVDNLPTRMLAHKNGPYALVHQIAKRKFETGQEAAEVEKLWIEFVKASDYRVGNTREYVLYHDEAVSFALELARGEDLPDAT